jgi:hypothetical protein
MRFAGLKFIFEICHQLQLEACLCDVIMTFKYQVRAGRWSPWTPEKKQMNILLLVDMTIEGASPSHARQE